MCPLVPMTKGLEFGATTFLEDILYFGECEFSSNLTATF